MISDGKKYIKTALLAAAFIMLTGCSKTTERTDEGFEKIKALDYSGAVASFDEAVQNGEDPETALRGRGMAYMGLMDYESAVASFEEALSHAGLFPSDMELDINYYLATSQYKAGDLQGAVKTLDAIVESSKKSPEVYFLRGSIKLEGGDSNAGAEDMNLALYYAEHDTSMTIRIYQAFDQNGLKEEGRAYLSRAIEERLSEMSDYEKGMIYYYLEDYENARDNLEAFRAGGNNDPDTLLMLGKTYEQLGDSNYAGGLYQKYLNENEPVAQIWNQLGLCKLKSGEYQEAYNAFENGIAMEDNAAVIQDLRFNLIVACENLGDFQKAAALMADYIKDYPDHEAAKREYTFLQSR